jgi:hypothetical protein
MKIGKNQDLLPSGIVASKDRKYFYWSCTLTGLNTFANAERFKKIVANFGSEEKLAAEFVAAPVKKYLAAEFTIPQIVEMMKANGGTLPPLGGKKKKIEKVKRVLKPGLKTFSVGQIDIPVQLATGSVEVVKSPVYPWSGNPDYFKGGCVPVCVEEETKASCMYPARNLDDQCHSCPVYDRCQSSAKYSLADMKKPRESVKVKLIHSFSV